MIETQATSIEQLQAENAFLQNKRIVLEAQIANLQEQLAWFRRQIFGKRSERIIPTPDDQLEFAFEWPESQEVVAAEEKIIPAHSRRKPNRNGQDKITFPADLPVETTVLDLPEAQKVCSETGEPLVRIGEEITRKLAHKPGSFYIKEIIRPKYAHPEREEQGIFTADLPDSILPKCRADASLLAEVLVRKFADHLPLYRISEIFARDSIEISRKLLSQWVVRCGMALKPLYHEMWKRILESENVFIDESPVKLLESPKCRLAYMWLLVGGKSANPPYRVYDFSENRCHDNAARLLSGYKGVVHSDKYGAYEGLARDKSIIWCPCWAHIRRKFFEGESGDPALRGWVLRQIRYLYMLERVAWNRSPEERLRIRQEKEVPIIDKLITRIKARLVEGRILPKSKFREALGYFCGLIPHLKNYTNHPYAHLDNNVAERAIRPLALGRKNWLFFGSPEGGEAGAVILSLVQTCRGLDINPREYLEDIFRRLMGHNSQKLYELLPDQWLLSHQQHPV